MNRFDQALEDAELKVRSMDKPVRAVALVLSGLEHDDREWLLSRLPESRRDAVQEALGVLTTAEPAPDRARISVSGLQQLEMTPSRVLAHGLQKEPPVVVEVVLDALTRGKRRRVRRLLPVGAASQAGQAQIGERLRELVLCAAADHLAAPQTWRRAWVRGASLFRVRAQKADS